MKHFWWKIVGDTAALKASQLWLSSLMLAFIYHVLLHMFYGPPGLHHQHCRHNPAHHGPTLTWAWLQIWQHILGVEALWWLPTCDYVLQKERKGGLTSLWPSLPVCCGHTLVLNAYMWYSCNQANVYHIFGSIFLFCTVWLLWYKQIECFDMFLQGVTGETEQYLA